MTVTTEPPAPDGRTAGAPTRPWVRRVEGLHALLGSLPLGMFVSSAAFDVASHRSAQVGFARPSFWLLVLGLICGVGAGLPGLALAVARRGDSTGVGRDTLVHVVLTDLALVGFAISAVMRKGTFPDEPVAGAAMAMSAVALTVLLAGRLAGIRASAGHAQNSG